MVNNKRKSIKKLAPEDIPVIQPNACGIDVGAESIFVCVPANRDPEPIREFSTFTCELKNMANWLRKCGVTTIAMESTGVYWIPVFEILDQYGFDVLLVNAQHLKSVPGRKTDVADASWIQRLHSFGLLNGSFRPDDHVVAIRTYVRDYGGKIRLCGSRMCCGQTTKHSVLWEFHQYPSKNVDLLQKNRFFFLKNVRTPTIMNV